MPPSDTRWWKVTTKSKTKQGFWKFDDPTLAKKAAFDPRAKRELKSLEASRSVDLRQTCLMS